ncbi:hypothetical protein ACIQTT_06835 [Microbacterium sp. NPDC090225]|uniref:hypothetical protein n=1 Tax=Microbacterium sp. NPDC090225 TaxID=3364207 RepID=UPI00380AC2D6
MTDETEVNSWAELVGPCYTAAGMADTLGWTEAEVVRAADSLLFLAVRTSDGVVLYPAFQLHGGRVVDGLHEVLRILRTGTAGRWTWVQFLNVAIPGEVRQIENLYEGRLEDVLRDARHEAAAWRS